MEVAPRIDEGEAGHGRGDCAAFLQDLLGYCLTNGHRNLNNRTALKKGSLRRNGDLRAVGFLRLAAKLDVKDWHRAARGKEPGCSRFPLSPLPGARSLSTRMRHPVFEFTEPSPAPTPPPSLR